MAGSISRHSRLVGWAKVLLPLAALCLLSTMFLLARAPGGTSDIPFAEIEEIAREQRIAAPRFSGVAANGADIEVSARTARPEGALFTIDAPRARMLLPGGGEVTVTSGSGTISADGRSARLTGLAHVDSTLGYQMETAGMEADLDTGRLSSLGPLEVRAPYGALTAGALTLDASDAGGESLVFSGGVRLLYRPEP